MIIHYLKVAFRNLVKYKTQSIISIAGLAVGFTCFALSAIWLRWEMTYDSFHEDADRIYMLHQKINGLTSVSFPMPFASDLKRDFPEIECTCTTDLFGISYDMSDGSLIEINQLLVDSCFFTMFNVPFVAGSIDFLDNPNHVALTEEAAARYCSSESAIGEELGSDRHKKTVTALVKGWGTHTSLSFEALGRRNKFLEENRVMGASQIWVKLKKGVDVKSFQKKLYRYEPLKDENSRHEKGLEIIPINQWRFSSFSGKLILAIYYLVLFCVASGMIILCALFNYLSLFSSRLHMRMRELSLRMVCGSSNRKLYALLSMEFVLVLVFACLIGLTIIELTLPIFREFTGVEGGIYWESLCYFGSLILLTMLAFLSVIYHFNKHTLRLAMKGAVDKVRQQFFFRFSIVLQVAIGVLFIFTICVIIKQINHMRNGDIGMERKNIAVLFSRDRNKTSVIAEKLRQMPQITEVLENGSLLLYTYLASINVNEWDGKQPTDESRMLETIYSGETATKFYRFRLLKGKLFSDSVGNNGNILINETGAKSFGWDNPIGKKINDYTVIGMIKDVINVLPTEPVRPLLVVPHPPEQRELLEHVILFKYQNHSWEKVHNSIDSIMKEFPLPGYAILERDSYSNYDLINVEESYESFLESENVLLKLLSIAAVACILISAFGIYSFVTMTCERRRKEIAIRKVNGAKIGDILLIFLKEYTILLSISSVIAFSVGYVLMKRWLESYVIQTPISAWVYLVVFAIIVLVVVLSIGSRVWMAARQNPAEIIKSE